MDTEMVQSVGNRMVTALTEYLAGIGRPDYLAGLDWEFKLVDDPAACLPNGKIVLFGRSLEFADNPNHLAIVIGHEMAHAVARHGNERMSQQACCNRPDKSPPRCSAKPNTVKTARQWIFCQSVCFPEPT